eukprot:323354-Pelagomonas_calceolata.AAC.1
MPHSRKMLQDGVVDFSPRRIRKSFRIHFFACTQMSSAPWPQHLTITFNLEAPKTCGSDTSTPKLPTFICRFIDFKQTHDSIPKVPSQLISIIKDLYQDEKYILDGDKQASVQPTHSVKQGCKLSPLLISIYVNDTGCITEGETGAVTGLPDSTGCPV